MPKEKDIFLVAKYFQSPHDKSKTHKKGYMTDDKNIGYREAVTLTRGLKDKDLTANIILNLTQKTVFKCRFEGKNDWESLSKYYAKSYPQYIDLIATPEEDVLLGPAEIIADEADSPEITMKDIAEEQV